MSDFWQETISTAQRLRHELHQNPELGWHEWQTAAKVRACLDEWGISWRACADTGTVARIPSLKTNPYHQTSSPHIALRADIDALPIHEQTQKPYQSKNFGCMHACGHDGHTATLLGVARWLMQHQSELKGPVSLIFQPAEEGGHGALRMIESGALEGVDAIFGWHNWPALPFGQMLCPDGLVMCGNGTFNIRVIGKGGHASQPECCVNPVVVASAITQNLQQLVSLHIKATAPAVVAVTSIEAPSGATVIPNTAEIGGSVRVPTLDARDQIYRQIKRVSEQTAALYGAHVELDFQPRYGPTINHPQQAQIMRENWQFMAVHNDALSVLPANAPPVMASEDFSYYLQEIPGAFALIGADDGPEHQAPCHNANYDFNDGLIPLVSQLYAFLVGAPGAPSSAKPGG